MKAWAWTWTSQSGQQYLVSLQIIFLMLQHTVLHITKWQVGFTLFSEGGINSRRCMPANLWGCGICPGYWLAFGYDMWKVVFHNLL